uniref:Interleukin 6 receptor n=1 Tax=Sinocyclocheilus rhinocerous TaxID=307959 RepID=A0A673GCN3_9TELE
YEYEEDFPGDITVDGVPLASASVMNKKYRTKQREDITVSWTSQKGYANATQLTSMKGNATTGTYQKTDSAMYTKAKGDTTVTVKPPVTIRKEQTTSRRVLRAVTQTTGQEEEVFGITMGTDFEQDDYEDYDYEEERSRVTRGIKKRTRWTLNGRQVHAGVERGGILRRPHLSWADAGNYSCYRGERLISTVRISIGVLHAAKLCVSNTAGSAMSPYLSFKLHDIIKPDPPTRVVVRAVEGQKHMLKVSWSYPSSWKHGFYALHFQLRYRPQLKEQYQSVLIDDRTDRQVSWTIYDALPHIQYEVQLQAKDDFDGLWSDWTDTVYAVTWTGNKIHEPLEMFPEGSGGSGEDPCVVAVDGADDIEYATVWLYVSCVFGLCFLVVFTMLTVCLHRNRLHFMSRIGKQTLPFAFFLHSPRPLPAPVHSEQLPEEGKSLMSPPKHSQQDFLPVQQEGIHLHNMDYFLSPGTEGVPWTIDRHD